MMRTHYLRRRVFVRHKHGCLRVRITRKNGQNPLGHIIVMTGVIGVLTIELFKLMRALGAYIYLLPVVLLLLGLWWWLVRYSIRDGFGVDKITVQNGDLHWKSKALWLKQEVNIPVNAISAVRAVTPCHGLQNRVELTVKKGTYKMGEGILRGEAEQLAHVLKQTLEIN